MKLETINKDNRKKIIIGSMIVLSVVAVVTFTTTRAKYKSTQSLKIAKGTVNIKSYDFKIMAMKQSEDGVNYTDIDTMSKSGYVINEEKTYCTNDGITQVKGKLKTNVNGEHVFSGLNKSDKCYIWFDKLTGQTSSTILASIKARTDGSYKGATSPTFSSEATGAETAANNGIYETDDPMYGDNTKTYYWRGAATTNHVIFANKCWRIVRINGDGTMRLIYNGSVQTGNTCFGNGSNADSIAKTSVAYNGSYNNSAYVGWTYTASTQWPGSSSTDSNAKIQLESWYSSNIAGTNAEKVADGYYCNDRTVGTGGSSTTWSATGTSFYYAPRTRSLANSPSLTCTNSKDKYTLKVGLITSDEVILAGGRGANNTSYYLYNGQYYWTMSSSDWGGSGTYVFRVNDYGYLNNGSVTNTTPGLRPVINLKADTQFNAESDGTQDKPYIVQ